MRWRELLHLNETNPLPATFFDAPRRAHFVGIGGIGMSALALLLHARGHAVSGSDASDSAMLAKLRAAGITCHVGHAAQHADGAEALFYSSAISESNPEFAAAKAGGIPLWHRSQLLAHFVNRAKTSIAVSGTHGKSTTSAMIAHILTECGHNPTAVLGAVYPPFDSNLRIGDPDLVVVEADESDGSFTLLKPTVAVVLNVEPEHLENYDDSEEELWRAFEMFVQDTMPVLNAEDSKLISRLAYLDPEEKSLNYSLVDEGPLTARAGKASEGKNPFSIRFLNKPVGDVELVVPGVHNVSNSLAAIGAAWCFKFGQLGPEKNQDTALWPQHLRELANPLRTFTGTLRRFEKKGEAHGVVFYDDYGHHPTEVKATLEAAKEFLDRPLFVIFQPHRYSRTQQLGAEFGPAFGAADKIVITQLYSAFEEPIPGVSGRIVYDAVRESCPDKLVHYAETLEAAQELAMEHLRPGDALLTMGAGDITRLGPRLLEQWGARHGG